MKHLLFENHFIPCESKKFTRLASYGIKSMRPIFKTKTLVFQSKANIDEKILFGKITGFVRDLYGNQKFHIPFWSVVYARLK